MKLRTNAFDLWVFHRQGSSPEYLLYHTSQEKADKWFHGGRFWQIPGGFVQENEELTDAFVRVMAESDLKPLVVWAAEHTYTYYNPRRKNIEIVPPSSRQRPQVRKMFRFPGNTLNPDGSRRRSVQSACSSAV